MRLFHSKTAVFLITGLSLGGCLSPTESSTSFPDNGRYVLEMIGSATLPTSLGTPDGAEIIADTLVVTDGPGGDEPVRSVQRRTTVRINSANVVLPPVDYVLVRRAAGLILFRDCQSLEDCDSNVTGQTQITVSGIAVEASLFAQLPVPFFIYRKL
ncbi:MAG: hypothetical protein HOP28_05920 [Gemmatimonadales bacterium]|nr:hypothetical protein [Gemmatimonadales bacterium]